jgi:hypothetical protein
MADRSGRPFMSLFLHLMLQWVGVIECVVGVVGRHCMALLGRAY